MHDVPTGPGAPEPTAQRYDIRVTGHLADRWVAVFGGMTLAPQDDGTTVLRGPLADQSALHGLLRTLSDLGLPLVSVTTVPETTAPMPTTPVPLAPVPTESGKPHESQHNPQSIDRSLGAHPTRSKP